MGKVRGTYEAQTETVTAFYLLKSGGKLNLWLIIGSVIGGILLIVIIAIILWRCGFFKREKHYQVEKWKRASQRRSQAPESEKNDIPMNDTHDGNDV